MNKYIFTLTHKAILNNPPKFTIPDCDYKEIDEHQNYEILIRGNKIAIGTPTETMTGTKVNNIENVRFGMYTDNKQILHMFRLSIFAGGRFIIYDNGAELTIFGSGRPVISSVIGKLAEIN